MTLYVNKAEIRSELHGRATWGSLPGCSCQSRRRSIIGESFSPEAEDDWCIITANWVNIDCDDIDEVYRNNYRACTTALHAAMVKTPKRYQLTHALTQLSNPFFTPKA